jgi:ribulose-phosphate 3-epimerase
VFRIAPSLMCADLLRIESQVEDLERAGARLFHIDVMDGHFVPNLGLNFDFVRQLRRITKAELDVHLIVDSPEDYIEEIRAHRIEFVSFHIEVSTAPLRLARALRAAGAKPGIALNPSTPIQTIEYAIDEFDFVLLMTVERGLAGQKFIPAMYKKIGALRELLDSVRPGIDIEVDGNLDVDSASRSIRSGATTLVGRTSSVFRSEQDVYSAYTQFRQELELALKSTEKASLFKLAAEANS